MNEQMKDTESVEDKTKELFMDFVFGNNDTTLLKGKSAEGNSICLNMRFAMLLKDTFSVSAFFVVIAFESNSLIFESDNLSIAKAFYNNLITKP